MSQVLTLSYILNQYGLPRDVTEIVCKDRSLVDSEDLSPCTSLTKLDLSSNRLSSLLRLSSASSLTQLIVASNRLTSLKHVHHLKHLRLLNIANNAIEALEPLHSLHSLQCLIANQNSITHLPAPPHALPASLQTLVLSHNQLSNVNHLTHLTQLTKLSLSYNGLTVLPSSIASLVCLTELRLNHNRLSSLPSSLSQCARLKLVDVGHNALPSLMAVQSLMELPYLRNLQLRGNDCARLPGYREEVLTMIPLLTVLDSGKVERAKTNKGRDTGEGRHQKQPTRVDVDVEETKEDQRQSLTSPRRKPSPVRVERESPHFPLSPSIDLSRKRAISPGPPAPPSLSSSEQKTPPAFAPSHSAQCNDEVPLIKRRRKSKPAVTDSIPTSDALSAVASSVAVDAEAVAEAALDFADLSAAAERRRREMEKERRKEERLLREKGKAAGVVDVRVIRREPTTGFSLEELTRADEQRHEVGLGIAQPGTAWDDAAAEDAQPVMPVKEPRPLQAVVGGGELRKANKGGRTPERRKTPQ